MAGNQKREQLIADIDIVEALAGHRILRLQHQPQQITGLLVFRHPAALGDQLVGDRVQVAAVRLVLALGAQHQGRLDGQAPRAAPRLREHPHHCLDERMHLILIVRVEAIAETA